MIRINFRKNAQTKVVTHRQRAPLTAGIFLMSVAIFLILALLILFLVRSCVGRRASEQGIDLAAQHGLAGIQDPATGDIRPSVCLEAVFSASEERM